jgi:hypothetical protein
MALAALSPYTRVLLPAICVFSFFFRLAVAVNYQRTARRDPVIVDDAKNSGRPADAVVDDELKVVDDKVDGSRPDDKILSLQSPRSAPIDEGIPRQCLRIVD